MASRCCRVRAGGRSCRRWSGSLPIPDGGGCARCPKGSRPPVSITPAAAPPPCVDPAAGAPAVQDLVDRIRALPPARHGRPLILSVGRLNRVKGFPTLI